MSSTIRCKTLTGQPFSIEVEPTQRVAEVKMLIEQQQGEAFPAGRLKLIFKGQVLPDDKPMGDYNIQDADFLVVMVAKATAAPAVPPPPAPAPAPAPPPAPAPASAAAPAPARAPPGTGAAPPPALVAQLREMGFPESQVLAALRAANNDMNLAIEFLFSGVPEGAGTAAVGAPGGGTAGPGARFAGHPAFEELRRMVRENPGRLEAAVAQLEQQHPDLLALMNQDPEGFWAALDAAGVEGGEEEEEEGGEAEGAMATELSAADEAAIGRLVEMGFGREQATQAYILAGRNEDAAVNFLLGG